MCIRDRYIALPAEAYKLALNKFEKGKTGTLFHGEQKVGVKITDLLRSGDAH